MQVKTGEGEGDMSSLSSHCCHRRVRVGVRVGAAHHCCVDVDIASSTLLCPHIDVIAVIAVYIIAIYVIVSSC